MANIKKMYRVQMRLQSYPYTRVNQAMLAKSHGDALERVMRKIIGWRFIKGEAFVTRVELLYSIDMQTGKTF